MVRTRECKDALQCNLKFLKQTENANKKLIQEKGRGPYPSLTPALIKDQNKALRYTPQGQRRNRAKRPKTTRRLTTLAKALLSKAKRKKKNRHSSKTTRKDVTFENVNYGKG